MGQRDLQFLENVLCADSFEHVRIRTLSVEFENITVSIYFNRACSMIRQSNYVNISRIAHPYRKKKVLKKSSLECKIDYDEIPTHALRSNNNNNNNNNNNEQ